MALQYAQYGDRSVNSWKAPCVAATTANLSDLTAVSVTQDGVTLVQGDRLLVRAQSTASQNGVYVVGAVSGTAPITRSDDCSAADQFDGMLVVVKQGDAYGKSIWGLDTTGAITLGSTSLTFSRRDGGRNASSGTVQTTDATQTTALSYTPADGKVSMVTAVIAGRKSDGTAAAGYVCSATFRRAGATTTQVGTTTATGTNEDSAPWDATLDASSSAIRVRVTGAAATTIDWTASIHVVTAPA